METTEEKTNSQKQRCRTIEPSTVELAAFCVGGHFIHLKGMAKRHLLQGVYEMYTPCRGIVQVGTET